MNDQQVIDRVVAAIDAITSVHGDPVDIRAVDVTDAPATTWPRRRIAVLASLVLVVAVAFGAIVLLERPSNTEPASPPRPTTSNPDASLPETTASGPDPSADHADVVLPYRLDLAGVAPSGTEYTDPTTSTVAVDLVSRDGSFDRLIEIASTPLWSAQPPAAAGGPIADVPAGEAHWDAPEDVLHWRVDDQQLAVRGFGVDRSEILAAAISWRAGSVPDDLVTEAEWSIDEVVPSVQYQMFSLERRSGPAFLVGSSVERTTIDDLPAWRSERPDWMTLTWRVERGTWMSLTGPPQGFDAVVAALRRQDVPARPTIGTLHLPIDGGRDVQVIDGLSRELVSYERGAEALLLDGSHALGALGTGNSVVFLTPTPGEATYVGLDAVQPLDEISWRGADGVEATYIVNGVGGLGAQQNELVDGDDLVLMSFYDGNMQVRTVVNATRVSPTGEEQPLARVDQPVDGGLGLMIEQPGSRLVVRTADGQLVRRASGLQGVPTIGPYEGVCVQVVGSLCPFPSAADGPIILDGSTTPQLGPWLVWANVPANAQVVALRRRGSEQWQHPIDGLAALPQPADDDWELLALDGRGVPVGRFDAEMLAAARVRVEADHPTRSDTTDQVAQSENIDVITSATNAMQDCLVAAGAWFGEPISLPRFADGVDSGPIWDACLAAALAASSTP